MTNECVCGLPTCDECSAAAAAGAWMQHFAGIDDREHILPSPAIVWLKAQLLQQTRTVDRAARPMTIVQTSAYVFVAACWTMLLSWKWDAIVAWANTLRPSHFLMTATGGSNAASLTLTFFMVVALLSSATVMLALHTILAED
ncbi:MAG: hypothetical protein QOI24_3728 [Acidobacteriota bacterium]|nr:hypothetical protein [Acidobacteriota bacterium]